MTATESMPLIMFFLLAFGICATLFFAVDRGQRPMQRRLGDLAVKFRIGESAPVDEQASHGLAATFMEFAQRRMPEPDLQKPTVEKLVQTLRYAGFYRPAAPKIFQLIRITLAGGCAVLGYLIAVATGASTLFYMLVAGAAAYTLPIFY